MNGFQLKHTKKILLGWMMVFSVSAIGKNTPWKYPCKNESQFQNMMNQAFDEIGEELGEKTSEELRLLLGGSTTTAQEATLLAPQIFRGKVMMAGLAIECWAELKALTETNPKELSEYRNQHRIWRRCLEKIYGEPLPPYAAYLSNCLKK